MAENDPAAQSETPGAPDPTVETTTMEPGETPGTTTEAPSPDDVHKELERLKASLKRANAEAKEHREKATELDKLKARIEDEKLTEKQRLEKQLAELQKTHNEHVLQAQERLVNAEIRSQLALQGIKNPKVARLIDRERLEYDDDGTPTNVADLLKELFKEIPELAGGKATPSSGGATNPARSQTSGPQELSWEYIGALTPADYDKMSAGERQRITMWITNNPARYGQKLK